MVNESEVEMGGVPSFVAAAVRICANNDLRFYTQWRLVLAVSREAPDCCCKHVMFRRAFTHRCFLLRDLQGGVSLASDVSSRPVSSHCGCDAVLHHCCYGTWSAEQGLPSSKLIFCRLCIYICIYHVLQG